MSASPALDGARSPPMSPTDGPRRPSVVHSPVGSGVRSPVGGAVRSSTGGERRPSNPFGPRGSLALPRTSLAAPAREPGAINPYAPPSLEYDLRQRKRSIFIFWFLILFDSIVMPLALYFGLWYGTNLSPNTVFSIVTAALGGISIFEYVLRFWHLWKKGSTCRVIGGRRSYLDWFHWNFSFAWIIIIVELIVGTIPENPPIRLLAMPCASLMFAFGSELIIQDGMRLLGIPSPFRISSMPAGSQLRPGIYWIIEDIVAVDGGGNIEFRERLNTRYEASHYFRQMLHRLTLFWGIGGELAAAVVTALIFTLQKDAAYVVGWTVPFIWAGIWTLCTFWYVKRSLRFEEENWAETHGKPVV
ncbi:hypothetical protein D6C93_02317 [Aureobasidium pullulans]|nr:hypothetical protein D6C93_02317 [Aureobasidium pullulans]